MACSESLSGRSRHSTGPRPTTPTRPASSAAPGARLKVSTDPEVGGRAPAITSTRVLLPLPAGPTQPTAAPASMLKPTWSRARTTLSRRRTHLRRRATRSTTRSRTSTTASALLTSPRLPGRTVLSTQIAAHRSGRQPVAVAGQRFDQAVGHQPVEAPGALEDVAQPEVRYPLGQGGGVDGTEF